MKRILLALVMAVTAGWSAITQVTSQTEGTATTTSTLALSGRARRNYLIIQNKGSVNIYVKFNSAHTGGQKILEIPALGNLEFNTTVPTGDVYIQSASGSQGYAIVEGIAP